MWEEVVLLVVILVVLVLVFLAVVVVVVVEEVEVDKPVEDLLFRVKWKVKWLVSLGLKSLGLKRCEQRYLFILILALVEYKVMWISSVVKSVSCIGRKESL